MAKKKADVASRSVPPTKPKPDVATPLKSDDRRDVVNDENQPARGKQKEKGVWPLFRAPDPVSKNKKKVAVTSSSKKKKETASRSSISVPPAAFFGVDSDAVDDEKMEEEDDGVFRTPDPVSRKNKKKGALTSSTKKKKETASRSSISVPPAYAAPSDVTGLDSDAVDEGEKMEEEEDAEFRAPGPVSKNKKKGAVTSSSKKKKETASRSSFSVPPANAAPSEVTGVDSDAVDEGEKMEEEEDDVFRPSDPVSKNKKRGALKPSTRKTKETASRSSISVPPAAFFGVDSDAVDDEKMEEEEDDVFRAPDLVSKKNKKKGALTSSSKKKKETASRPSKSMPPAASSKVTGVDSDADDDEKMEEEDAEFRTPDLISKKNKKKGLSSVSSAASRVTSTSDSDAEDNVPLQAEEGETAREELDRLYWKISRLKHERGTINARVDWEFPDLVKPVPGHIPFIHTSNRARRLIANWIEETELRIAQGKTTKAEREKAAAALRRKMYSKLEKKIKRVNDRIVIVLPLAEIEKRNEEANKE